MNRTPTGDTSSMGEEDPPGADERLRELFAGAERQTAEAAEQLVQRQAFGELLARMTENVIAVAGIGISTVDLIVRNLRLAGRADITRLGRQLARTEDKLEMVLQEVEVLRDELTASSRSTSKTSNAGTGASRRKRPRGGGSQ